MKITFGFAAHSGWAALVILGGPLEEPEVIDRRRVDLVQEEWAKAPYHAAEELEAVEARKLVQLGVQAAHKNAKRQMKDLIKWTQKYDYELAGCAVLMGNPMPSWSTDEILAVHFRMHKAEGVLFRKALASAAENCGLKLFRVPEKDLDNYSLKTLAIPFTRVQTILTQLGKAIGPPWTKDQKDATLAAMIALHGKPL
ncbi:MAG TPA: hypothetical protein VI306_08760 [Pyrinomonadaceae bacterium]